MYSLPSATLIDNFSNPNVLYQGVPTGVAEAVPCPSQIGADNAQCVNNIASFVAAYRSTTLLDSASLINNDTQFQFRISGPSGANCTVDFTADFSGWNNLGTYTLSGGSVIVTDSGVGSQLRRFYRAKHGSNGEYKSVNSVGFYKITAPSGYSMIANQLNNSPDNKLATVIPSLPAGSDGTTAYKWNVAAQSYFVSVYWGGQWNNDPADPDMFFNPGDGFIFLNDTAITLKFVGEILNGTPAIAIPVEYAIRGSMVPQSGQLDTILKFPTSNGTVVQRMTGSDLTYTTYTFNGTSWSPSPPTVSVGESFWSKRNYPAAATTWVRTFLIWP